MNNTDARQPARRLDFTAASTPRPQEVESGATAVSSTSAPPTVRTTQRPTTHQGERRPVTMIPRPSASTPFVPVPAMHAELKQPLHEIVERRGAQDFQEMFRDLVRLGVSDVHMKKSALNGTFTVEGRVDGDPEHIHRYSGSEAQTIHTLIKTESKLSTGMNLVPQDGNYELPMDGYPYRARVVSLPLFDGGEYIVFRLPQIGELRAIEQLGFTSENLDATKALLDTPGGMTLFAGPTGEGKSTTALSSLQYLRQKQPGVFISVEDPVERVIDGIAQIEVKEEVEGAGFGDMMRYLVRSDPNVVFIGEIRDARTATFAVEIAKSGIRVLATIHATNNISAMLRLMELADAPPLSVLESVNGVVSQRLVSRLASDGEHFSGRYPIHEVTKNSIRLTDALIRNVSRTEITDVAAATSTTFKQNVDLLVANKVTTLVEARKVVPNV